MRFGLFFVLIPKITAVFVGAGELLAEFLAGVGGENFVEPGGFGGLSFTGEDFDDVAMLELGIETDEFAVDFGAGDVAADFGM